MPHQGALRVELEHGWRAGAAVLRRLQLETLLVVGEGVGAAVHDPDMILLIHPHTDGVAEQPVVWQRLRPHRIHLEARRLRAGTGLRIDEYADGPLPCREGEEHEDKHGTGDLLCTHGRAFYLAPPPAGRSHIPLNTKPRACSCGARRRTVSAACRRSARASRWWPS